MLLTHLIAGLTLASGTSAAFGTLGWQKVLWWGIPIVLQGPANPPAPTGQPVIPPRPIPPIGSTLFQYPCLVSCRMTMTITSVLVSTTTSVSISVSVSVSTETSTTTATMTTPGIMPTDIAQGSADYAQTGPAAPTPMFNEYGGFQCCIPIQTRDASGIMIDVC